MVVLNSIFPSIVPVCFFYATGVGMAYHYAAGIVQPVREARLDDQGMSSIHGGDRDFSLLHIIQTGYVAHPASYPVGPRGSSLGVARSRHKYDHPPPHSGQG
jgi:hypothetical protein